MSQHENNRTSEPVDEPGTTDTTTPPAEEQVMVHETPIQASAPAGNDVAPTTIGTGTSIALGCIAGTVLLIGIGLIYLLIAAVF